MCTYRSQPFVEDNLVEATQHWFPGRILLTVKFLLWLSVPLGILCWNLHTQKNLIRYISLKLTSSFSTLTFQDLHGNHPSMTIIFGLNFHVVGFHSNLN